MVRAVVRILYTAVDTPIPGTHGGSVHALELCRALSAIDHEVHLIAPPGEHDGLAREPGLHLHHINRPPRFLEWSCDDLVRSIAERLKPDVIVDRFYTFGGAGILAARKLGIPAVLEVNSPARPYPGSWRDQLDRLSMVRPIDRWRRRLLEWSDAIYTTSAHLVPPDMQRSVTVVTNGVDIDRFCPGPVAEGPLRCVYASSFRSWHGAEDLVEAVRECVSRGVELRVTCLGEGPRSAAARRSADRAGLSDAINFVGRVPFGDVPGYLADADVGLAPFNPTAFPALQLGWFWSPIKIFEYLACGLTVVTIGIEELQSLLPGSVARFYDAGDIRGLADVLETLAARPDVIRQARDESRQLAESRYSWHQQARAVEGVLTAVSAGRVTSSRK
jgi:glycosyltransferase involved in cell wall biosynthesis